MAVLPQNAENQRNEACGERTTHIECLCRKVSLPLRNASVDAVCQAQCCYFIALRIREMLRLPVEVTPPCLLCVLQSLVL